MDVNIKQYYTGLVITYSGTRYWSSSSVRNYLKNLKLRKQYYPQIGKSLINNSV